MFDFIFQGVTNQSHEAAVLDLLGLQGLQRGILSVAFANASGVALIEDALRPVRRRIDAFVGIRNDITSAQGLKRLRPFVNRLFIVDTGGRSPIFHPKVYLARSQTAANLVVGSANLTTGGLWNNIEASLKLELDLTDAANRVGIERLAELFDGLPGQHPNNVVQITTDAAIDALLDAGRVVDEDVAQPPRPTRSGRNPNADVVPRMRMQLQRRAPPVPPIRAAAVLRRARGGAQIGAGVAVNVRQGYVLVWESNALKRRDLNIPTGANTARTGSMLFKKGALDNIDQRHFFRDEVFADLAWQHDAKPAKRHLERAEATFRAIIKNIDYGEFVLRLTHDTRTTSPSYAQGNSMTQVHWGAVAEHVRHANLLGRTLYLYRNQARPDHFIIEID